MAGILTAQVGSWNDTSLQSSSGRPCGETVFEGIPEGFNRFSSRSRNRTRCSVEIPAFVSPSDFPIPSSYSPWICTKFWLTTWCRCFLGVDDVLLLCRFGRLCCACSPCFLVVFCVFCVVSFVFRFFCVLRFLVSCVRLFQSARRLIRVVVWRIVTNTGRQNKKNSLANNLAS